MRNEWKARHPVGWGVGGAALSSPASAQLSAPPGTLHRAADAVSDRRQPQLSADLGGDTVVSGGICAMASLNEKPSS